MQPTRGANTNRNIMIGMHFEKNPARSELLYRYAAASKRGKERCWRRSHNPFKAAGLDRFEGGAEPMTQKRNDPSASFRLLLRSRTSSESCRNNVACTVCRTRGGRTIKTARNISALRHRHRHLSTISSPCQISTTYTIITPPCTLSSPA